MFFMKLNSAVQIFCIAILGVVFAGGSLSLMYYYPMVLAVIFISCIAILHHKISLKAEHFFIAVLLLIMIFNISTSLDNISNSKAVVSILLFFIMFFLLTLHNPTLNDLKAISQCFIISGFLIALFVLFFKMPTDENPNRYTYLLYGKSLEPNYLACYLSITFIITFRKLMFKTTIVKKFFYVIISLSILYAILISGSRGAFVAILLSALILFSIDLKTFLMRLSVLTICFVLLFMFLPENLIERFIAKSYNDGSNRHRIFLFQTAIAFILDKPFIGYGITAGSYITKLGSTHNTFLTCGLNFGLVGLAAFCALIFKILKNILNKDMRLFLAVFVNLMVTSMIITNLNTIPLWFTLVFLVYAVNYRIKNPQVSLWNEL